MSDTVPSAEVPGLRRRLRFPIWLILVAGFGGLVLVAVTGVLLLGVTSLGRTTFVLLGDKANLALDNVATRVASQFEPVADQAEFLAGLIVRGELDPAEPEAMATAFRAALAATPQVTGISFADLDYNAVRVGRFDGEALIFMGPLGGMPDFRAITDEAIERRVPFWADPIWEPQLGQSIVSVRRAVFRDDRPVGVLMIGVSIGDLSRFLSRLYVETGMDGFLIYDRDHVLAHKRLPDLELDFAASGAEPPLPTVGQLGDAVLSAVWREEGERELVEHPQGNFTVAAIGDEGDDGEEPESLILMRPTIAYGSRPWTLGVVFPAAEVTAQVEALFRSVAVSLLILVVSVVAAFLISVPISRKVSRLAEAARSLSTLDVSQVPTLPDSRVREIAAATAAFNAMVAGLRSFETYVPRTLVLRLLRGGGQVVSEERSVTVMFTDIVGFSTLAERAGAAQVAELLNRHFSVVAKCIEAEGGTVDKYIGDGLMAFWGAPDDQPDHAARAVRAAHAIAQAVCHEADRQRAADQSPVRVRIGLHSGPAVAGNIGSASRINYTLVGDTVNMAARIEQLGVGLQGDADAIVLASAATVETATEDDPAAVGSCVSAGAPVLAGRSGTVELFRLAD